MKKTLIVSFLTLAVLLSVWSGGQEESSASGKEIDLVVMWNSATISLYEPVFSEYSKWHPGVDVIVDSVPYSELPTKTMLALIDPKAEHDVLLLDRTGFPSYAATGHLVDLDTLGPYDWDDFYEGALADGIYRDMKYGVPCRVNTLGMIYNKKFFREAGLPMPTEDFNWSDFENAAGKFKKGDNYGYVTFYARGRLSVNPWMGIMYSHGGDLFTDDWHPRFNDTLGVKAMQQFKDYLKYGPVGMANWDINGAHEAFRQGKAGMIFTWSGSFWAVGADPDKSVPGKTNDGVFRPLPKGDKRMATVAGSYTVAIPKVSKNIEAAWTFCKWLGSEEIQRIFVDKGAHAARISICTDPELLAVNRGFEGLAKTWELAGEGNMTTPDLAQNLGVQEILAKYVNTAVVGQMSPKQALDAAAEEVEILLKEE